MAGKTLNGILTVNFNVKEECYSLIPTKQMLQKARHPRGVIPDRREPDRRVPLGRVHLDERRLDEVQ